MSNSNSTLSQSRLMELLHYEPETGLFTWINYKYRSKSGNVAGWTRPDGRRIICIDGERYRAHRLVWLYVYGRFPFEEIDHINGIPDDNKISNLREASRKDNQQNARKARSDSKSGLIGASPKRNKWQARITSNGETKVIGVFKTALEAHLAYVKVKRELHPFCTI